MTQIPGACSVTPCGRTIRTTVAFLIPPFIPLLNGPDILLDSCVHLYPGQFSILLQNFFIRIVHVKHPQSSSYFGNPGFNRGQKRVLPGNLMFKHRHYVLVYRSFGNQVVNDNTFTLALAVESGICLLV